jgi:chromosome partitioning protein
LDKDRGKRMIIAVASSNEEVGKSVIAANVATLRALVGRSVLLLDITPKKSSFEWGKQRTHANIAPKIAAQALKGKNLKSEFDAIAARFNDVIIDTDWRNTAGNQAALELADMVLVPVQPIDGSVECLKKTIRRIKAARRTNPDLWTLVVINRAGAAPAISQLDAIRRYVAKLPSASLAGTIIREQASLQHAYSAHLSIFEYKPADPNAIAEMHDLYRAQKLRRSTLPSLSRLQKRGAP